jgi:GR25 family glycosyltransferase involved in LPS biosynthesis
MKLPEDFDIEAYRILNDDLNNFSDDELIDHYLKHGIFENREYKYSLAEDFDPNIYRILNNDLHHLNTEELIDHYLNHGINEKREYKYTLPENFDLDIYRILNDDLNHLTNKELIHHYFEYGINENRVYYYKLPEDFNEFVYKEHHHDLNNMNFKELKEHYILHGQYENRIYKIDFNKNNYLNDDMIEYTDNIDNHYNLNFTIHLPIFFKKINIYINNNLKRDIFNDLQISTFVMNDINNKLSYLKKLFLDIYNLNNVNHSLIICTEVKINNNREIEHLQDILYNNTYFDIIELTYIENNINFYNIIENKGYIYKIDDYSFDCFLITKVGINKIINNINNNNNILDNLNIGVYNKPIFKINTFNSTHTINNNKKKIDLILWDLYYKVTSIWNKIYCVNLKFDIEKSNNMKKYCNLLNYNEKSFFYQGILGYNLPDINKLIELNIYHKSSVDKNLKIGTIGLNITQKNILKEAYKNNYEYILLLEDDIYFHSNYFIVLDKLFSKYKNIDTLYLGFSNGEDSYNVFNVIDNIDNYAVFEPKKNIVRKIVIGGLFAVILSKKAIKIFYENFKVINNVSDIQLCDISFNIKNKFSDNYIKKIDYQLNTYFLNNLFRVSKNNPSLTEDKDYNVLSTLKKNKYCNYLSKINKIKFLVKNNHKIIFFIYEKAMKYYSKIFNIIISLFKNYEIKTIIDETIDVFIYCFEDEVNINNNSLNIFINGEKENKYEDSDIGIVCTKKNYIHKYNIYFPQLFSSLYERKNNYKVLLNNHKTKFCAYMYSYNLEYRVNLYKYISTYKKVDSLGKSCNEEGYNDDRHVYNDDETYNDIAVQKYSTYKFVLALENGIQEGYVTEKLINPIIAGSIPIYAGPNDIFNIINKERLIYIYDFTDYYDLLEYIKEVDNNDGLYNSIIEKKIFVNEINFDNFEEKLIIDLKKAFSMTSKNILINDTDLIYYNEKIDLTINNISEHIYYSYLNNCLKDYIQKDDTIIIDTKITRLLNCIKFYFINLDHRIDRYHLCEEEFKKVGLFNVERFSAIKPSLEELEKSNVTINKEKIWKKDEKYYIGASGCKLSHYYILKKALLENNDQKYICIFEDDIVFEYDALNNLYNSIEYIEKNNIDFDILFFSTHLNEKEDAVKIGDYLLKLNKGLTTTAQIFQTSKLEKIIKKIEKSDAEIDNAYRDFLENKYCIYPMCVYQRNSYSDIGDKDSDYGFFHKKFIY